MQSLEQIHHIVWNAGLLALLLGTGVLITLRTGFFQVRGVRKIRQTLWKSLRKDASGTGVSQWKVCTAALSASMGTGNIVGVTAALSVGGAGAVFWMWCSAFFGMMLTYGENVLSMRFRRKDAQGNWIGGPMAYLRYGLGARWLAALYAVLCILASFGMGCMTQSSAAASALQEAFSVPPVVTGLVVMALLAVVVLGGVQSVGNVTQILLPLVAAGYMLLALVTIGLHVTQIPAAFHAIFSQAFGLQQVGGGALGTAISAGLRHGIFSNEAGLGSSALIHSHADGAEEDFALQGMWSMFEVFLDTMVCCTLTALAVMTAGVPLQMGVAPVSAAFSDVLGTAASGVTAGMMALFAFCTMLGWCCCGETAVRSLCGRQRIIQGYRFSFCLFGGLGAVGTLSSVWLLSDIANGCMAIPNLLGLLLLMRWIQTPPVKRQHRTKSKTGKAWIQCG